MHHITHPVNIICTFKNNILPNFKICLVADKYVLVAGASGSEFPVSQPLLSCLVHHPPTHLPPTCQKEKKKTEIICSSSKPEDFSQTSSQKITHFDTRPQLTLNEVGVYFHKSFSTYSLGA